MANLTREQRAAKVAALQKNDGDLSEYGPVIGHQIPTDDGLILMAKESEVLRVHPSCTKAHQRLGWQVSADV